MSSSDIEIYIRYCLHVFFEEYELVLNTIKAHRNLFINPDPICDTIFNLLEEKWYLKHSQGVKRYLL
jgi:hypothetical protein